MLAKKCDSSNYLNKAKKNSIAASAPTIDEHPIDCMTVATVRKNGFMGSFYERKEGGVYYYGNFVCALS